MLSTAGKRIEGWREARDDLCREGKMRQQVADLRHVRPAPRDVQHVALRHQHAAPAAAPEKVAAAVRRRKAAKDKRSAPWERGERRRTAVAHSRVVGRDGLGDGAARPPSTPGQLTPAHADHPGLVCWFGGLGERTACAGPSSAGGAGRPPDPGPRPSSAWSEETWSC